MFLVLGEGGVGFGVSFMSNLVCAAQRALGAGRFEEAMFRSVVKPHRREKVDSVVVGSRGSPCTMATSRGGGYFGNVTTLAGGGSVGSPTTCDMTLVDLANTRIVAYEDLPRGTLVGFRAWRRDGQIPEGDDAYGPDDGGRRTFALPGDGGSRPASVGVVDFASPIGGNG